jgi:hypothetical protein
MVVAAAAAVKVPLDVLETNFECCVHHQFITTIVLNQLLAAIKVLSPSCCLMFFTSSCDSITREKKKVCTNDFVKDHIISYVKYREVHFVPFFIVLKRFG